MIERLVVTGRERGDPADDLPLEDPHAAQLALRARGSERRRTVADDLFKRLVDEHESFWTTVYPLYMQREITRTQRARRGSQGARRSARQLQDRDAALQHAPTDYKKFLNFLRKHDCQLPFKEYR